MAPRAQGVDKRVVGEFGPGEVEGVPEEYHETRRPRALRELRDEARLADSGIATKQDGRAAPRPRVFQRALELREFASASDEHASSAGHHRGQYPARGRPKGVQRER